MVSLYFSASSFYPFLFISLLIISSGVNLPSLPCSAILRKANAHEGLFCAIRFKSESGDLASSLASSSVGTPSSFDRTCKTSSDGKRRPSSMSERKGAVIPVRLASSRKDRSSLLRASLTFSPRDCCMCKLTLPYFRWVVKKTPGFPRG